MIRKRYLHVANGTSTTGTIEAAGIPGQLSIWADPLHDGPVPGDLSDDALVEKRGAFLAALAEHVDPVNDLRRWREVIAARDGWDELVLWYEHDLFDQLNLIQLLSWIHDRLGTDAPVSLICIGSYQGRPEFKGLGELTPGELAPLFETRTPVSSEQYGLAQRAWDAFRSPSPDDLDALRRTDTSQLPYLAAALTRFLEEYPWTKDGLSRSERRLLELSAGGTTLRDAFPRMHDGETAYYITDTSLIVMTQELSATTPALLELTADGWKLTRSGEDVLQGRQDRIGLCGIDRWMGGVHLRPGHTWRWNDPGIIPG